MVLDHSGMKAYLTREESERRSACLEALIAHRDNLTYFPYLGMAYEFCGRTDEAVDASREAV